MPVRQSPAPSGASRAAHQRPRPRTAASPPDPPFVAPLPGSATYNRILAEVDELDAFIRRVDGRLDTFEDLVSLWERLKERKRRSSAMERDTASESEPAAASAMATDGATIVQSPVLTSVAVISPLAMTSSPPPTAPQQNTTSKIGPAAASVANHDHRIIKQIAGLADESDPTSETGTAVAPAASTDCATIAPVKGAHSPATTRLPPPHTAQPASPTTPRPPRFTVHKQVPTSEMEPAAAPMAAMDRAPTSTMLILTSAPAFSPLRPARSPLPHLLGAQQTTSTTTESPRPSTAAARHSSLNASLAHQLLQVPIFLTLLRAENASQVPALLTPLPTDTAVLRPLPGSLSGMAHAPAAGNEERQHLRACLPPHLPTPTPPPLSSPLPTPADEARGGAATAGPAHRGRPRTGAKEACFGQHETTSEGPRRSSFPTSLRDPSAHPGAVLSSQSITEAVSPAEFLSNRLPVMIKAELDADNGCNFSPSSHNIVRWPSTSSTDWPTVTTTSWR